MYHEHNVWNTMLEALCHFEVLACHFSLDVLCDKSSSLPVVTDNVSVRNWSPPLPSIRCN